MRDVKSVSLGRKDSVSLTEGVAFDQAWVCSWRFYNQRESSRVSEDSGECAREPLGVLKSREVAR